MMSLSLRVRFDGRAFVPEQPVDIPAGQSFDADFRQVGEGPVPPEVIQQRKARLRAATGFIRSGAPIPDEALSRETLYEDRW
jgi:hypothetical protein